MLSVTAWLTLGLRRLWKAGDMIPRMSIFDCPDGLDSNAAILFGQDSHNFAIAETPVNNPHVLFRQHRLCGFLSPRWILWSRVSCSSFFFLIQHIVMGCSYKQVVQSNAGWIVALMQHVQTFWNRTIGQLPNNAVSQKVFPLAVEAPVPSGLGVPLPIATAIRLFGTNAAEELVTLLWGPLRNGEVQTTGTPAITMARCDRLRLHSFLHHRIECLAPGRTSGSGAVLPYSTRFRGK